MTTRCRWPFVLALFVAVQVTACSFVASAWPGGGIGYPNTMIYDTWQGRTAAATMNAGVHGQATGATVIARGVSNDASLQGDGGHDAGLFIAGGGLDRASSGTFVYEGDSAGHDVWIEQQGTSKGTISFLTGDGAGANAGRMTIDSDKVKITTNPGTSTGVLVGADSGALDLKANAAGGGEWDLLSGGSITTTSPVSFGASALPVSNIQQCTCAGVTTALAANSCRVDTCAVSGCTWRSTSVPFLQLGGLGPAGLIQMAENTGAAFKIYTCNVTTGSLTPNTGSAYTQTFDIIN